MGVFGRRRGGPSGCGAPGDARSRWSDLSGDALREALEIAQIGRWEMDCATGAIVWSDEVFRIFGRDPAQGEPGYDEVVALIHPDDRAQFTRLVELARTQGAGYETEWRVVRPDGEVRWKLTRARAFRGPDGRVARLVGIDVDITERKRAANTLLESESRYRAIVDTAVDPIIVIDETGAIEAFNGAAERTFGYAVGAVLGRNVRMLMPEPYRAAHDGYIRHYVATGERRIIGIGRTIEAQRADGSTFPAELAVAEWRAGGRRHFTGILRDITERIRAEEQINLLAAEVDHRAKNLLNVIQALVRVTTASTVESYAASLSGRIAALARCHSLLAENRWQKASLRSVLKDELEAHGYGERVDVRAAADFHLRGSIAQPVAMVLHELATNSAKYGALSSGDGRVAVGWRTDATHLHVEWEESGGPPVVPPERPGFGLDMMVRTVERQLEGTIALDWRPGGLRCRISVPM